MNTLEVYSLTVFCPLIKGFKSSAAFSLTYPGKARGIKNRLLRRTRQRFVLGEELAKLIKLKLVDKSVSGLSILYQTIHVEGRVDRAKLFAGDIQIPKLLFEGSNFINSELAGHY